MQCEAGCEAVRHIGDRLAVLTSANLLEGMGFFMFVGWGGRIRTYGTRYQKPMPYHLATPQREGLITLTLIRVQDPFLKKTTGFAFLVITP